MNRSTGIYKKNNNPFFSFIGKNFSKEKTCTAHYHYDLHGNVKMIIQDNAQISFAAQRYKKIDYEYDLISGKVNAVHYQDNQPDQFHHKYEYDADNRITDVYTSKDKILWDHDAKYFYYPHGPLARIEYGDNHVQGMDYAYTLQGWVKAVNSETLSETRDIGHDGNPTTGNANSHFAKDVFGYSLTYFENDYQSIGTSNFEANKQNSDLLKSRNDLFNGNISAMVTTLVPPTLQGNTISYSPLPQGTAYKYDQLNRLIEMQAWQNIDAVNNIWGSGLAYTGMYNNKFTYDGNGNILTQLRNDQNGVAVNDLTYNRMKDANGKLKQNRLYWVDDAVDKDVFADDIDDQSSGNYAYDELGSLKQNVQKEIAEIKYSIYGKVKEVIRASGSNKKNLKFDYDATGNRIAKHIYSSAGVWEKSEFYARDAQGNVMSIYKNENDAATQTASFAQIEKPIYGSSRIGTEKTKVELIGTSPIDTTQSVRVLGNKEFEGVNHLGNVLTTFSDKKIPIDANNDGTVDEYWPHVISSTDYYPFGVAMKERSFNSLSARHGFNTQEKVNELGPSHYTAEYWEYDGDLAERENLDPKPIADESPYAVNRGNPIFNNDPDGDCPNGDCPTVNVSLTAKINFGGKSGISGSIGLGAGLNYQPVNFLRLGVGGSGSLNFGGLGSSSLTPSRRFDFGGTFTATGGTGTTGAQSLQTINSLQPSGIMNTMKYSGTLGVSYLGGTDNRSQFTGYTGFRIKDFSAGHSNDVYFKTDQYWGAVTNMKIGTEGGLNAAIWNEVYNGSRLTGKGGVHTPGDKAGYNSKNWLGRSYETMLVRQDTRDISLNSGRTFISMNFPMQTGGILNMTFGSEGGWNMFTQRGWHYGAGYDQFQHNKTESKGFIGAGFGF